MINIIRNPPVVQLSLLAIFIIIWGRKHSFRILPTNWTIALIKNHRTTDALRKEQ